MVRLVVPLRERLHRLEWPRWAALRALVSLRRRGLIPLVLALPPLVWVLLAAERASLTTLGRDQGIFQYVAWAVRHGERDYADVRDVNGPLIHLVHVAFQLLGGEDEHRFRVLDLAVSAAAFFLAGAALPGITLGTKAPLGPRRAPPLWLRAAWGFAAAIVLMGQYLGYLYWDLAQRDSFCDWFVLAAVSFQLLAQTPGAFSPRARRVWLGLAGAASVVVWFGKPTYAPFTVVQLAALFFDGSAGDGRRARLVPFVVGGAVAAASQLVFLVGWGDVGAFVRVYLVDVPAFYRFIWPRPVDIYILLNHIMY